MLLRIFTEPQQGASYEQLLEVARTAEAQGFDAFFRSDHFLSMGTDGLPGLAELLADHRSLLRRQLAVTLAPELRSHGGGAPYLLEALDVTTGWEAWHALRHHARHSASSAERVTVYAVTHLLR